MPALSYEVVDVFTAARFGGNPLAVITDARGLSAADMQRIAVEFGYSETTFVLPPEDAQHTAGVRIFTPTAELPFAGHPNVGTAFVLARGRSVLGRPAGDEMWFEEQAGLVHVTVLRKDGAVSGAAIRAPRALEVGQQVPAELVAACASLSPEDIAVGQHPPLVLSIGLPFVFAELADRAALARARPNRDRFLEADAAVPPHNGAFSLFLYVPAPGGPRRYSARMFAPLDNVQEDPATGSAAAALAAYLASRRPASQDEFELVIEQGVDMGRPSQLNLRVRKITGGAQEVIVSGDCVPVMRGELTV
jgi:trans-2,3-dihydro-3-hydroxyanthranilate isomerase